MRTLIVASLVLAASTAKAESVPAGEVEGWVLLRDVEREKCSIAATFGQSDDLMSFHYN